jgi:hypothetical protein
VKSVSASESSANDQAERYPEKFAPTNMGWCTSIVRVGGIIQRKTTHRTEVRHRFRENRKYPSIYRQDTTEPPAPCLPCVPPADIWHRRRRDSGMEGELVVGPMIPCRCVRERALGPGRRVEGGSEQGKGKR